MEFDGDLEKEDFDEYIWAGSPTEWVRKEGEKLKTQSCDISVLSHGERAGLLETDLGSRNIGWKKW